MTPGALIVQAAQKGQAAKPESAPKSEMLTVVHPSALDRWQTERIASYTPARVEATLRGALQGDPYHQWRLFDLMEDTWPRLAKNLAELKRAVVAMDWQVKPWAEEDTPPTKEATRRARLVSHAVWTMKPEATENENGFEATVRDLMDGWGKGLSVIELLWEIRSSPSMGNFVGPRATKWIQPRYYGYPTAQDWLGLKVDELKTAEAEMVRTEAEVPTLRLTPKLEDYAPFPPNKFLIGIYKSKTGHPLAGALLRPLAFIWAASNFAWEYFINLAQIFGMPIRWGTYASNASQSTITALMDMLKNMGSAAYAAFPEGTNLQILDAIKGGSGNSPSESLIDRADTICDLMILGQTLTSTVGNSGSRALGEVHFAVREDVINAASEWVATILNEQFVPAFLRLNFNDENEPPEFWPEFRREEDAVKLAQRDEVLLRQKVRLPEGWFYRRHGIPLPQEGERVVVGSGAEKPDATAMAAAQASGRSLPVKASAQDKLAVAVLESVTGVEASWLGGTVPWFQKLVAAADDDKLSDAEFIALIERAHASAPDQLAPLINPKAVAEAMYANMSAAAVNGFVEGFLKRQGGGK